MKPGSKVIGLTVGQKSILLAEVAPRGGRNAVQHFAEFTYPEGLSLATPDQLGIALGQFIKTRKFSTRDVVIGLPAKRLVTRRKELPAASAAVAASTLRLQAEGEFSSELDNLVMDFAGTPSSTEPTTVLLVATNREVLDQCETMAKSAGLKVHGITATTAALGRATSRLPGGDGWVLNLGQAGAELVAQHGQDPAHLRHLNSGSSTAPEAITALAGEIRRVMASVPQNGTPQTLALWRGPALATNPNAGTQLEQRLSIPVTTPGLNTLVSSENPEADAYAPAVAVALSAIEPAGLPVDFLHSRLAPPPEPLISTQNLILIIVGVLLIGVIGGSWYQMYRRNEVKEKLAVLVKQSTEQHNATTMQAKRVDDARGWMPKSPFFVRVLRDVSKHFPTQSNTIWVTRLSSSRDKYTWEIDGKSTSDTLPRRLQQDLSGDGNLFGDVRVAALLKDSAGPLYTYKIIFTYKGAE